MAQDPDIQPQKTTRSLNRDTMEKERTEGWTEDPETGTINVFQANYPAQSSFNDPDGHLADHRQFRRLVAGARNTKDPFGNRDKWYPTIRNMSYTIPFLQRMLRDVRNYTVEPGFRVSTKDETLYKFLMQEWASPINSLSRQWASILDSLLIHGELCLPCGINEITGELSITVANPDNINKVLVDERRSHVPIEVHVKRPKRSTDIQDGTEAVDKMRIVNSLPRISPDLFSRGKLCFYWSINNIPGIPRGTPFAFAIADHVAATDQYMFDSIEHASHMKTWFWDVTLEGMNRDEIKQWLDSELIRPPEQGAVRAHNEKVTWMGNSPKIEAGDTSTMAEMSRDYVANSLGLPLTWYTSDAQTRSAGADAQEPGFKFLQYMQGFAVNMIVDIFNAMIDATLLSRPGITLPFKSAAYEVVIPRLNVRDFQRFAGVMKSAFPSIIEGFEKGILTPEETDSIKDELFASIGMGFPKGESVPPDSVVRLITAKTGSEFEAATDERIERLRKLQDKLIDNVINPPQPVTPQTPNIPKPRSSNN